MFCLRLSSIINRANYYLLKNQLVKGFLNSQYFANIKYL